MKFLTALAFFSLTALASAKSESFQASETINQSFPLTAHGSLRLANLNGSVEITAWDKNEVSIEAEKRARNTEDLALIHVDFDAHPDHVSVNTTHEKVSALFGSNVRGEVRYRIKVPAGAKLEKISSVNSVLTVTDVRGPVTLQTVNGTIRATGLAGDARLETVNGSITARFAEVSAEQSIEVESVNGSCTIFLPKEVSARVSLASVNGSASCDFPITLERSSRRALRGTIGTGAIALKASTVNGSVRLNRL